MKFLLHSMSRLALGILGFVFAAVCVQAQTALPAGRVGVAYTVTFTSGTSLPAGTVFSATGLPAGLGINGSSGTIAGTPSAAGNFNLTVSVAVNGVTNNYPYTLLVNPPTGTPTRT